MKTLLEFLEENRSTLQDGVYHVGGFGNIVRNGSVLRDQRCDGFDDILK